MDLGEIQRDRQRDDKITSETTLTFLGKRTMEFSEIGVERILFSVV